MASEFAPLAAIPDALSTARTVLSDCPRIHVETAVGQFAGTAALIRHQIPELLTEALGLAAPVTAAADQALAALDGFGRWLQDRLAGGEPGRDPRLGRRLWEARLWHALDTELTAADLFARAWATFEDGGARLREAAAELVGGTPDDATVRRALDRLAQDHPDNATIVDLAKLTPTEATDFLVAHDLVSTVDGPGVVQAVHCDGMTEADAMDLMTRRGFQEEGEAAGKWRRALLTSAQLSTYFVGYTEVAAIAAARPTGTAVRDWHDAMLAHGSPPPRHV